MQCGYRFRFYPTPEQKDFLVRSIGCARFIYNRALEARKEAWRKHGTPIGYKQTSALLTGWKKNPGLSWLNEVSCVPLQQALRHLDSAYQCFFKGLARYPRFRRKHDRQSIEFTKSAFQIRDGELYLAKIKHSLNVRWSRDLPSHPTTITVTLEADGRWYVSCRVEDGREKLTGGHDSVGIDLGITHFATLSTGEKIEAPKPLKAALSRLAKAQRRHARAAKNGKNRAKRRLKVARLHSRVRNVRSDWLHKLSTRLIRENQATSVETLNVKGMLKNRKLSRAIGDLGWSEFVRQLEYKAQWYGRVLTKVDTWFPSSKTCSCCGEKVSEMPLKVRVWTCGACGAAHDRDINAALNMDAAGQAVRACGGDVRRDGPMAILQPPAKQESLPEMVGIPVRYDREDVNCLDADYPLWDNEAVSRRTNDAFAEMLPPLGEP